MSSITFALFACFLVFSATATQAASKKEDNQRRLLSGSYDSYASYDSIDSDDSSAYYGYGYDEAQTTLAGGLTGPDNETDSNITVIVIEDDTNTTASTLAECACSAFSEECPDCAFVDRCGDGAECTLTITAAGAVSVTALQCNAGLATQQSFAVLTTPASGVCLELGDNSNQSGGLTDAENAACIGDLVTLAIELGCTITSSV